MAAGLGQTVTVVRAAENPDHDYNGGGNNNSYEAGGGVHYDVDDHELYLTLNMTMSDHMKCLQAQLQPYPDDDRIYCNTTFDRILCWPISLTGSTAILPCPRVLNGVQYDTSKSASRHCYVNGTWDVYTNYTQCRPLIDDHLEENFHDTDTTSIIYYIGYSLSLVAVVISLFIFLYFKDLRCLRNTFHANLMATYLLLDLAWIITASLRIEPDQTHMAHCSMMVILYYFQGTNFFWMFVEGFYLYMLVVRTFTVDKIKFKVYIFFGWGLPMIAVGLWAIVKVEMTQPIESSGTSGCPWLVKDVYDWIFITPILAVLIINLIFLGNVMWVLITKLRAATSVESQQYRKASKALLVLIPLLGITYIIVIVAPTKGLMAKVLAYLRAVLLSTQGFTVSVLYCFLNGEVRNTLRHHVNNWRTAHNLGGAQTLCSRHRNGSLRSRTESIRLCSAVNMDCRCDDPSPANTNAKEKCASCMTMMIGGLSENGLSSKVGASNTNVSVSHSNDDGSS